LSVPQDTKNTKKKQHTYTHTHTYINQIGGSSVTMIFACISEHQTHKQRNNTTTDTSIKTSGSSLLNFLQGKRVLYLHKKPYISSKEPYICAKDPNFHKRFLNVHKKALYLHKREKIQK